jgi:hypothetical protein
MSCQINVPFFWAGGVGGGGVTKTMYVLCTYDLLYTAVKFLSEHDLISEILKNFYIDRSTTTFMVWLLYSCYGSANMTKGD